MTMLKELLLRLKLDSKGVETGLKSAERGLQGFATKAKGAMAGVGKATDNLISNITNLKSLIAVGLTVAAVNAADSFNQLRAKIDNVAGGAAGGAVALKMLIETANRTGGAVEAMGSSFVRLLPAKQLIGATDKDLIDFIETIQKAGAVGGAMPQEISAAMYQLSQGIGSGTLAGEELRSTLEQLQPVARMIADEAIRRGLIKSFGELKQAAADGLIGPELVFAAIARGAKETDEAFNKLPPSVGRSTNLLKTMWLQFLDTLNQSGGVTDNIATLFVNLAEQIPAAMKYIEKETGISFAAIAGFAGDAFKWIVNQSATLAKNLALSFIYAGRQIQIVFLDIQLVARKALENVANAISSITGVKFNISAGLNTKQLEADIKGLKGRNAALRKEAMTPVNLFTPIKSAGVRNVRTAFTPFSLGGDEGGGKGKKGKSDAEKAADKAKKDAEREKEALKSAAEKIFEGTRTVMEKRAQAIAELNKLRKLYPQIINDDTFKRKLVDIDKEFAPDIDGAMEDWKRVFDRFKETVDKGVDDIATEGVATSEAFNESFNRYKQLLDEIQTPQEAYAERLQEIIDLQKEYGLTQEQVNAAVEKADETLANATKTGETYGEAIIGVMEGIGQKTEDALIDAFKNGEFSAKSFFSAILEDIMRLIFRLTILQPLMDGLTGAFGGKKGKGGSAGGGLGGLLGGVFKGILGFADGGSPPVGRPSIVGERGPELFVPSTSGTVIPNEALGGGGGAVTVNQNISLAGDFTPATRAEIMRMAPTLYRDFMGKFKKEIINGGSMARIVGR